MEFRVGYFLQEFLANWLTIIDVSIVCIVDDNVATIDSGAP